MYICSVWLLCDVTSIMCDECSIPIGHPFVCVKFIPNLEGVVRSRDLAYAPDTELALPILQHLSLSPRLSGSLVNFLYPDDF